MDIELEKTERMKELGRKTIIKTKDFYIDALKKNNYSLLNKDIYCKNFQIFEYSFIILETDSPTREECYLNISLLNGQLSTTLEIRLDYSAYVFDIEPVMTFEAAGELYRKGNLFPTTRHLLKLCD